MALFWGPQGGLLFGQRSTFFPAFFFANSFDLGGGLLLDQSSRIPGWTSIRARTKQRQWTSMREGVLIYFDPTRELCFSEK